MCCLYSHFLLFLLTLVQVWSFRYVTPSWSTTQQRNWAFLAIKPKSSFTTLPAMQVIGNGKGKFYRSHSGFSIWSAPAHQHLLFSLDDSIIPASKAVAEATHDLSTMIRVSMSLITIYCTIYCIVFMSANASQVERTRIQSHTLKPYPSSLRVVEPKALKANTINYNRNIVERSSPASSSGVKAFPWMKCKLVSKKPIDSRFTIYTFKAVEEKAQDLSGKSFLSRQIILCLLNDDGQLAKQSFYPLINKGDFGNNHLFQIIVDNSRSSSRKISGILAHWSEEEELACKVGSKIIDYDGQENPIKHLTLIASDLGIVPIVQLIKNIFLQKDVDLSGLELIWINQSKDQFVLSDMVEDIEKQYPDKFSCVRVVDKGIELPGISLNEKLKKILPHAERGRVAVIAGSKTIHAKFKRALTVDQNYELGNIISIKDLD